MHYILALIAAALSFHAAANPAANPGVKTLDQGVTVQITKPSNGVKPAANATVTVHYRGTLKDGTEFDSSYKRNQPATFPLGNLVPCWKIAIPEIPVGASAKIVCPSATAYGPNAVGPIPPNSTLFFDLEVIATK